MALGMDFAYTELSMAFLLLGCLFLWGWISLVLVVLRMLIDEKSHQIYVNGAFLASIAQ
jgi:hypothetical protein